ncbi:hypothetical protein GCM10028805_54450 [Spirosoma harenae]
MENPFEIIQQEIRHLQGLVSQLLARPVSVRDEPELPIFMEVAEKILGVSQSTIYKHIKDIPHYKRNGKLYFFQSELLAYIRGELPQSEPKTVIHKRAKPGPKPKIA